MGLPRMDPYLGMDLHRIYQQLPIVDPSYQSFSRCWVWICMVVVLRLDLLLALFLLLEQGEILWVLQMEGMSLDKRDGGELLGG